MPTLKSTLLVESTMYQPACTDPPKNSVLPTVNLRIGCLNICRAQCMKGSSRASIFLVCWHLAQPIDVFRWFSRPALIVGRRVNSGIERARLRWTFSWNGTTERTKQYYTLLTDSWHSCSEAMDQQNYKRQIGNVSLENDKTKEVHFPLKNFNPKDSIAFENFTLILSCVASIWNWCLIWKSPDLVWWVVKGALDTNYEPGTLASNDHNQLKYNSYFESIFHLCCRFTLRYLPILALKAKL